MIEMRCHGGPIRLVAICYRPCPAAPGAGTVSAAGMWHRSSAASCRPSASWLRDVACCGPWPWRQSPVNPLLRRRPVGSTRQGVATGRDVLADTGRRMAGREQRHRGEQQPESKCQSQWSRHDDGPCCDDDENAYPAWFSREPAPRGGPSRRHVRSAAARIGRGFAKGRHGVEER